MKIKGEVFRTKEGGILYNIHGVPIDPNDGQSEDEISFCVRLKLIIYSFLWEKTPFLWVIIVPMQHFLINEALHHVDSIEMYHILNIMCTQSCSQINNSKRCVHKICLTMNCRQVDRNLENMAVNSCSEQGLPMFHTIVHSQRNHTNKKKFAVTLLQKQKI